MKFETHITVERPESREKFAAACSFAGTQPLIYVMPERHGSGVVRHHMTKNKLSVPSRASAVDHMNEVAEKLVASGLTILRRKVEAEPVPCAAADAEYFEGHIKVFRVAENDLPTLRQALLRMGCYVSWSALASADDIGFMDIAVTARVPARAGCDGAVARVAEVRTWLKSLGCRIEPATKVEMIVFDSNPTLDDEWLGPDWKRKLS